MAVSTDFELRTDSACFGWCVDPHVDPQSSPAPMLRGVTVAPHECDILRSNLCAHPLYARRGTSSDSDVFDQVFVEREYACLDDLERVELIVDCGANVGYSSAYFLTRFPHAEVVAVEPDAGNYGMLRINTAPYGDRITTLQAAVWSHAGSVVMEEDSYRDGREWSRQVRATRPGEVGRIRAVTVAELLAESRHERISILKMDIEGAEAVVFSEACESWLSAVDSIIIELHNDSSFGPTTDIFRSAISAQRFVVSRSGQLTVCRRWTWRRWATVRWAAVMRRLTQSRRPDSNRGPLHYE